MFEFEEEDECHKLVRTEDDTIPLKTEEQTKNSPKHIQTPKRKEKESLKNFFTPKSKSKTPLNRCNVTTANSPATPGIAELQGRLEPT